LRLLLDAVALLRAATASEALGKAALAAIEDPRNDRIVSAATVWEIAIKAAAGRLNLDRPTDQWVAWQQRELLLGLHPISTEDALRAAALPGHHADPFDRMLVAQAQALRASIVTNDFAIRRYEVEVIW
jgi:PIN domain nuclease of toxin-antitoxin system